MHFAWKNKQQGCRSLIILEDLKENNHQRSEKLNKQLSIMALQGFSWLRIGLWPNAFFILLTISWEKNIRREEGRGELVSFSASP